MYTRTGALVHRKFREFYPPMLIMSLALAMGIVGNSIIVGNFLGPSGLGTLQIIFPMIQCMIMVCGLFGIGGATLVARSKGERNNKKANVILSLSLTAIILFGITSVLLGLYALDPIVSFLVKDSELHALTREYLQVYLLGAPVFMLVMSVVYFIRTDGLPKLASNILLTANILILLLDLLFLGPLQMGIKGAALATIVGYTAGGLLIMFYVKSPLRTLHPTKFKAADMTLYGDMTAAGISSALGQVLMLLKLIFVNKLIMDISGSVGLAAFSVCMSCLSISSVLLNGAAQTMIPMAGNFYGERDSTGIIYTVRRALLFLFISCAALMVLVELFPVQVLGIYGVTSPENVAVGVKALRIFAVLQILFSFSFFMMYYTQTIKMPKFSAAICIVEGYALVVPLCIWLSSRVGLEGVWWAFLLAEVGTALFILLGGMVIAKRSKGKLTPFYLVEKPQADIPELDVSIENSNKQATGVSQQVIDFCTMHQIGEAKALQTGILIEDMAMNIIDFNKKKNTTMHMDIRVKLFPGEILVAFRDDGLPLDSTHYSEETNDTYNIKSIDMVRKVASRMEYSRAIGLNCTSLHLQR